jgi:hypothetical protein
MEDQIHHQEMERKKVLDLKESLVSSKKTIRNQLALQIIQSILERNQLKTLQMKERKKTLVFKERKSLKAEVTDLKVLPSKNTVKKELKSKIF